MSCALPFVGMPPKRNSCIDDHAIGFNPAEWKRDIASPTLTWHPSLDSLPVWHDSPGVRTDLREISRRNVFDLMAPASTAENALYGYVASAVWGSGQTLKLRLLAHQVLGQNVKDDIVKSRFLRADVGDKLLDAITASRSDPVGAFVLLHGKDGTNGKLSGVRPSGYVPWLGSSFGTKVLYFGAYESLRAVQLRPLILDANVITGLRLLCPRLVMDSSRPTADQYKAYLELASQWAAAWGTEPDMIERLLFAYGKDPKDEFVRSLLP